MIQPVTRHPHGVCMLTGRRRKRRNATVRPWQPARRKGATARARRGRGSLKGRSDSFSYRCMAVKRDELEAHWVLYETIPRSKSRPLSGTHARTHAHTHTHTHTCTCTCTRAFTHTGHSLRQFGSRRLRKGIAACCDSKARRSNPLPPAVTQMHAGAIHCRLL